MQATENGTLTKFIGGHYEETGSQITKHYFAGTSRIATRKYTVPSSMSLEYVLGDHLGSSTVNTDDAGAKVSEMRYKPWGEVRYSWKASASHSLADYTLRQAQGTAFTGQYSYMDDPSTSGVTEGFGLMFYNARWYDPGLGRFAQADSIVPAGVQGWDRYAYVNNNPVKYKDPSGHCAVGDSDVCIKSDKPKGSNSGNGGAGQQGGAYGDSWEGDDMSIYQGYSDWETQILEELYKHGGAEAQYGVLYILRNQIHISVGTPVAFGQVIGDGIPPAITGDWQSLGATAAWFEPSTNSIVLNPNAGYTVGDMPNPWGLSMVIHEAKHLEQGRLTKYGELEAWQIGFRVAEKLGHYGVDGIATGSIEDSILSLPLSSDQTTIDSFSDYVWAYSPSYWLPFWNLDDR